MAKVRAYRDERRPIRLKRRALAVNIDMVRLLFKRRSAPEVRFHIFAVCPHNCTPFPREIDSDDGASIYAHPRQFICAAAASATAAAGLKSAMHDAATAAAVGGSPCRPLSAVIRRSPIGRIQGAARRRGQGAHVETMYMLRVLLIYFVL